MFSKLNRNFLNKISFRLTFGYAILFILSSIFILFLNYFLFSRSIKSRDHDILYSKAKEYSSIYIKNGLEDLEKYLADEKLTDIDTQYLIRISSADLKTVFLHVPEKMQQNSRALLEEKLSSLGFSKGISRFFLKESSSDDPNEDNEYEVAHLQFLNSQHIQVARNTDERDDLLERSLETILMALVIVLLVGSFGGFLFSNQAMAPLRNLIQAIKSVRSGALTTRIPVQNSNDELDEISLLFNEMAERIERLVFNMQETLDSVAHDLRTPLTRLKSKSELALLNKSSEAEYKSALEHTIENTSEIVSFINTIMDISEAEVGVLKLNLVMVSSKNLINEVIDLYSIIAEEKNIFIEFASIDDHHFLADKNRCKQVLSNLIDNAIKYSEKNKCVRISTQIKDQVFEICILDQGLGISEYDLPKIWERLFRSNDSKSIKGLGLGLSLVKSICKSHGWGIEVQSEYGIGSEFKISIAMKT